MLTPQLRKLLSYAFQVSRAGNSLEVTQELCRLSFSDARGFQEEIRQVHRVAMADRPLYRIYRTGLYDGDISKMLTRWGIKHERVEAAVMTVDRTSIVRAIDYNEEACYQFVLELIREAVNDNTCYVAWSGRSDDHLTVEVLRHLDKL
jgi:hypothetical protein